MRLQKARQTEKAGRERQRMEKELVALLCFPRSVSRIDPGRTGSSLNGRTYYVTVKNVWWKATSPPFLLDINSNQTEVLWLMSQFRRPANTSMFRKDLQARVPRSGSMMNAIFTSDTGRLFLTGQRAAVCRSLVKTSGMKAFSRPSSLKPLL